MNSGNAGAQNHRKDLESPYRRFVVTTELRSETHNINNTKQSKFDDQFMILLTSCLVSLGGAGGKRGFLKGGFAFIGFGSLKSLSHYGELNGFPGVSALGAGAND